MGIANREFKGENYYVIVIANDDYIEERDINYLIQIYRSSNKLLIYMIMVDLQKSGYKSA